MELTIIDIRAESLSTKPSFTTNLNESGPKKLEFGL